MCDDKIFKSYYFGSSANKAADIRASQVLTNKIHNGFSDFFQAQAGLMVHSIYRLKMAVNHIMCFPRRVANALQEALTEELERLPCQQLIVCLGMEETSKWCNSFVLVTKANGEVRQCLDSTKLNRVLIGPVHRGQTLHDILPILADTKYLTPLDVSPDYINLN